MFSNTGAKGSVLRRTPVAAAAVYLAFATLAMCAMYSASGCAGTQKSQVPTASTSEELVDYTLPVVKPVETGTETQSQKQVIVAVIPRAFKVSDLPKKECVHGPEESKNMFAGLVVVNNGQPQKKPYVVMTQTGVDYEPKTLSFLLKITNHSDKVMRLVDLYLKVNIDSQEVAVAKVDVDAIKAGVLLKGEGKEFSVSVPEWNENSSDATIDFSLQNVPIEMEKNGQIAEVGDFSWTFLAKTETKQTRSTKTVENLMLDTAEAANLHCHPGALAAN